jgi:hypothetical protein
MAHIITVIVHLKCSLSFYRKRGTLSNVPIIVVMATSSLLLISIPAVLVTVPWDCQALVLPKVCGPTWELGPYCILPVGQPLRRIAQIDFTSKSVPSVGSGLVLE